ncbi:MAG: DUF2157 domain-containing protein [Acidimicrobiia bacterium]|nr:DUF2157 domain-containing protein [Acidimicrobiia bacterium]NNL28016.1 DUF2157 domain-containing protein [Acidimicrobiia bacterium]
MSSETNDAITQTEPDSAWLSGRVDDWTDRNIISTDQAEAILQFEGDRRGAVDKAANYSRLIAVVSAFGGILLGVGLILFVGSNWADIPRLAKVGLAILTVVALEGVGFWLKYYTDYVKTGGTFLLVGALAYGGAIALVAQTYNYPIDDPWILFLWFLPILPLAYIVRSQIMAALAILVGYWAIGTRVSSSVARFDDFSWIALYVTIGATIVAVGYAHSRWDEFAFMGRPYQWIGSTTVLGILYVMGFRGWWDDNGSNLPNGTPVWLWGLIIIGAIVISGVAFDVLHRRTDAKPIAAGVLIPAGAAAALLILMVAEGPAGLMAVLINLIMLGALGGLVWVGIATRQEALVNVSTLVFGITVITRYLEIGFGMLNTSLALMVGGLLLIGLSWFLERLRRGFIAQMEEST